MVSTIADVIEVRSPWDGRALGSVPAGGERQVDEAVSVALDGTGGRNCPPTGGRRSSTGWPTC